MKIINKKLLLLTLILSVLFVSNVNFNYSNKPNNKLPFTLQSSGNWVLSPFVIDDTGGGGLYLGGSSRTTMV